jgi:hypothetical protein
MLEECMAISREEKLDGILSDALTGMALIHQVEGEPARAEAAIQESIAAAEAAQDPTKVVTARLLAAQLCTTGGRREDAVRHLLCAAGLSHRVEPTLSEAVMVTLIQAERSLPKADVARLYKEYAAARRPAKR